MEGRLGDLPGPDRGGSTANPAAIARALREQAKAEARHAPPDAVMEQITKALGASIMSGIVPNGQALQGTGQGMTVYGDWTYGRNPQTPLPRPYQDFLGGDFSPLSPIVPMPVDNPREDSGRPMPRRWQYPVGWNMPIGVPGSEGLKLASFATLRQYADIYSVARSCIDLRKNEILGIDWDIVPTGLAEKQMQGDKAAYADWLQRKQQLVKFFRRPDTNFHTYHGWLSAILEDKFVIDATALYLHPTRNSGKGLLGSDLAELEIIAGDTIRPLLDIRGETPRPPAPAYEQYLWGVPRSDMTDILTPRDIEHDKDAVARYRSDQLMYLVHVPRSWTPYGFSEVERAMIPIMTGLKRQEYMLDYFTEGSVPAAIVVAGPDFASPQQIRMLQDILNAVAGDIGWKHKITVLPHGSDWKESRPANFMEGGDMTIQEWVLMAFEVQPLEVGLIMSRGSSSSSASAQNQQAQQSQRKALKPMLKWLKRSLFDYVIQEICKQDDMEWSWVGVDAQQDQQAKSNVDKTLVSFGAKSIDEIRNEWGMPAWGLPETSEPLIISPTGAEPISGLFERGRTGPSGGSIASTGSTGNPAEQPDTKPSPQEPATPTRGKPAQSPLSEGAHDTPNETPARPQADRAVQAELRKLRQFLRHGKEASEFRSPLLTPEAVEEAAGRILARGADRQASDTLAVAERIAERIAAPLEASLEALRKIA